jgi:serine/threonine-protein kinase HipA
VITADVYKADRHAATLRREPDRVVFEYVSGYDGVAVASTLPIGTGPVVAPAGQLPPFLTGLLPEGRRFSALVRALKVSADDELSLLLAVGGDTIGDVRVVAAGELPTDVEPAVDIEDPAALDFEQLFRQSIGDDIDRSSIPGVQEKVSGRMISFPVAGVSAPVIVKLEPPEYAHLPMVEQLMLGSAARAGFRVPAFQLLSDHRGKMGLVVARFDRRRRAGALLRYPVEDGCQVLGRYPADKYNLDTVDVIVRLADRSAAPMVARVQLFDRLLLSYLAGDGDLHARNLAIYAPESGLWQPAPVFDLVCTALYGDMTLAAPLAGRSGVRELGRRRFMEVADAVGIPQRMVAGLLDTRTPAIAGAVAETLDGPTRPWFPNVDKVRRMLGRRADLLLRE